MFYQNTYLSTVYLKNLHKIDHTKLDLQLHDTNCKIILNDNISQKD